MNSIKFPNMFNTCNTNVVRDSRDASLQCIRLLMYSEKGEFIYDPFFGIRLRRVMFEPNNDVLKDILVDEIYTQLQVFAPQITTQRKDIKIIQEGKNVKIRFKAINNLDFTTNMYELALFSSEER